MPEERESLSQHPSPEITILEQDGSHLSLYEFTKDIPTHTWFLKIQNEGLLWWRRVKDKPGSAGHAGSIPGPRRFYRPQSS